MCGSKAGFPARNSPKNRLSLIGRVRTAGERPRPRRGAFYGPGEFTVTVRTLFVTQTENRLDHTDDRFRFLFRRVVRVSCVVDHLDNRCVEATH